jgi:hypothetical protein
MIMGSAWGAEYTLTRDCVDGAQRDHLDRVVRDWITRLERGMHNAREEMLKRAERV